MADSAVDSAQAFETNNRWITDNLKPLKKSYSTQWVAVLNQTVVDNDAEVRKLVNRLKEAYAAVYSQIAVEYIPEDEPEMDPQAFSRPQT